MATPLLQVKNLSVKFSNDDGESTAVDSVSFQLNEGEVLGVAGESGSGKSVTAFSVMRLLASSANISGEILYTKEENPVDLLKLPEKKMPAYRGKEIAMIFQEPMTSLNPVFTCGYQVAEALLTHKKCTKKEVRQRVIELFNEVKLPRPAQLYDAYPHQVSGGQKQRVMIAMGLACQPRLLIADEPTTALDVTVQKTILDLMKNLQQERKMSMLFITHDLGVIAEIADRVLVMYKGKIVEQGSVKDIFLRPQHAYTKSLLACRPPLDKKLKKLPTLSDFMVQNADGSFHEKNTDINTIISGCEWQPYEEENRRKRIAAAENILNVNDLKIHFPVKKGLFSRTTDYVKAVDDVSFSVRKGEVLGLVGESGCGKTTLGRSIIRLTDTTSGEIIFRGKNITHLGFREMRSVRRNMQLIFQDPYSSLNPRMTIGYAIQEPMAVHGLYLDAYKRREKTIELLEKVGLSTMHYHRYPHEFSGGQRQRICIARALSLSPDFIICDESVSALDVSVQAQVLNLLNQLKEELGLTYIFISHNLSVVRFMADRILVMNKGKIVEEGSADEIYFNPKEEYTQSLLAAVPKEIF